MYKESISNTIIITLTFIFISILLSFPTNALSKSFSGKELVKGCDYKYQGDDRKSKLTIKLKKKKGTEKKTVSLRLWKNYHEKGDIRNKMVLYTEFPPDVKGSAFMRWEYTPNSGKTDDLWIYIPVLRKVRRISVRDINDKFMGSDLTYADIGYRDINADTHKLLGVENLNNTEYFAVESIPIEKNSFYSKKISWYRKVDNLDNCVKGRIDYYDNKGDLLKRQILKWQKIGKAWIWEKVVVNNFQTFHTSTFEVSDVKLNVGLKDRVFKKRSLKTGIR